MYNGEGVYKMLHGGILLKIFAVLMTAVRGITYCQHPPPAHGGPRFGGKGSNSCRKKLREQRVYK